jgi:alpha-1,2-mannosyltransferase
VTTVDQSLPSARSRLRDPDSLLARLTGWGPALLSFAAALGYGIYIALRTYEVDLGVYLRLGGRYVFTSHLYSFGLPNTSLFFTYPPFAALLFAPWQRAFSSVAPVQTVWTLVNLAALLALLMLTLHIVRPDFNRGSRVRLALVLSLPALLLNPVLLTVGFGQVNLVIVLLVMWDLLSERRIGKWNAPMGVATGLAAAVKLTPLLFIPFLLLTRRFRAAAVAAGTFVACELLTYAVSPTSSASFWTKALFRPNCAGDLSIVTNQNLTSVLDRLHHGIVPEPVVLPLIAAAAIAGLCLAALAHRRASPMLGVLVCAGTELLVSPISWAHHMVWIVPALLWLAMADGRPRRGRTVAAVTAAVFWSAPIWWVPYKNTTDLHLNGWQLLAGDSFFFALIVLLAGAAVLVARTPGRVGPLGLRHVDVAESTG